MLISGPVHVSAPHGVEVIGVRTAVEMRERVFENLERPASSLKRPPSRFPFEQSARFKNGRKPPRGCRWSSIPRPISGRAGPQEGRPVAGGLRRETENLRQEARRKLESKNCDMVVGNLVAAPMSVFESDENEVVLALSTGETLALERASKREIADRIFDEILKLRLSLHAAMKPDDLRRRLEFYQDIGVKTLYRQPAAAQVSDAETAEASAAEPAGTPAAAAEPGRHHPAPLAPVGDTLPSSSKTLAIARRCRLHEGATRSSSVLATIGRRCGLSAKARAPTKTRREFHSSDAPVNC